jgi:hypothetical protein
MINLFDPFIKIGLLNLVNIVYLLIYLTKDIIISIVERIWLISNKISIFFWISSITFLRSDSDWKTSIF